MRIDYIGVVGSSGNSTGPHLHFEVYSEIEWNGVGQDVLVDPYTGTCNTMNGDTWWQNQKPYNNPNINAVLTHSAPPVFTTCPTQETTNESNQFVANQSIYFGLYLRDQAAGTVINLKVIRPNNTVLYNWDFNLTDNYTASWWYWTFNTINIPGEWKWEATYLGQTVTHLFTLGTLSVEDNYLKHASIYPNPANDLININSVKKNIKAEIINVTGKTIKSIHHPSQGIKTINTSGLSNGLYFLMLESDAYEKKTIKFIKH